MHVNEGRPAGRPSSRCRRRCDGGCPRRTRTGTRVEHDDRADRPSPSRRRVRPARPVAPTPAGGSGRGVILSAVALIWAAASSASSSAASWPSVGCPVEACLDARDRHGPGERRSVRSDRRRRRRLRGRRERRRDPDAHRGDDEFAGVSPGPVSCVTADGEIVTNAHVVEGADTVQVRLPGETEPRLGTVIATDATNDLALVRIDATGLTPAIFADPADVRVGRRGRRDRLRPRPRR